MKRLPLFIIALLSLAVASAAPKVKAVSNTGLWRANGTWDLNRLPKAKDTVVIPAGKTITIDNVQALDSVYVMVQGTLKFTNILSYLSLDETSTIVVTSSGSVVGTLNYLQYIFLGNATVFSGSLVTGPKIANAGSGSGFINFALPVKFLGFDVASRGKDGIVQWSTTEEINADRFEIERSNNGQTWTKVGSVTAKGDVTGTNSYSFTDKEIGTTVSYYRIRQVDIDGRSVYTPVRMLKMDQTGMASEIRIRTISGKILLQFPQEVKGNTLVRIMNLNGQLLSHHQLTNAAGQITLDSQAPANGIVIVSVENGTRRTSSQVLL